MAKISRRKLVSGAVAASLAATVLPAVAQTPDTAVQAPPASRPDPIVGKVDSWIAERDTIDAMMEEWADLEVVLCDKIKPTGMSLSQAYRCGLPEARAMRRLDRKIKPGLRRLDRSAQRIALMRTNSAQGALAKVRLGMRIQGPYDWNDDYVYALVQDGCEQLALMLSA